MTAFNRVLLCDEFSGLLLVLPYTIFFFSQFSTGDKAWRATSNDPNSNSKWDFVTLRNRMRQEGRWRRKHFLANYWFNLDEFLRSLLMSLRRLRNTIYVMLTKIMNQFRAFMETSHLKKFIKTKFPAETQIINSFNLLLEWLFILW